MPSTKYPDETLANLEKAGVRKSTLQKLGGGHVFVPEGVSEEPAPGPIAAEGPALTGAGLLGASLADVQEAAPPAPEAAIPGLQDLQAQRAQDAEMAAQESLQAQQDVAEVDAFLAAQQAPATPPEPSQQEQAAAQYLQRIMQQVADAGAQVEQQLGDQEAMIRQEKIDPNRWWNSRSTGQKVAAVLGAALAGTRTGPNQILQMLDSAVAQDIAAQKADQATRLADRRAATQERLATVQERLATARENEGKLGKAKLQFQIAQQAQQPGTPDLRAVHQGFNHYAALEKQTEDLLAKARTPEQQANLEKVRAGIQAKKEMFRRAAVDGAQRQKLYTTDLYNKDLPREFLPADLQGLHFQGYGQARGPEQAKKFGDMLESAQGVQAGIDRLKALADMPFNDLNPVAQEAARVEIQNVIGSIRLAFFGSGAFTENEQKMARAIIGDPTKKASLELIELSKLDRLRNIMDSKIDASAAANIQGFEKRSNYRKQ